MIRERLDAMCHGWAPWVLTGCVVLYFAIGKTDYESRLAFGNMSVNQLLQVVVLLCLTFVIFRTPTRPLLVSRGFWLVASVTALLWIGAARSHNSAYALQKPIGYAGVVLPCLAILALWVRDASGVRRVLILWACLGLGMMLGGIAVLLGGMAPARLAVLGGGANVFARIVASSALVIYALGPGSARLRWLRFPLGLAFACALLFAGSKTAVLGLGAGFVTFGMYTGRRKLMLGALLGTVLFAISPTWINPVLQRADKDRGAVRMFRLPDSEDPRGSYGTRLRYYRDSLTLLRSNAVLGVGTGDWGVALHMPSGRRYPHNLLLEMGCEQGLAGWIVLGLLLACGWWWGRALHGLPGDGRLRGTVVALWVFWLFNAQFSGDLLDNRHVWWPLLLLEILWVEQCTAQSRSMALVHPERFASVTPKEFA